MKKMLTMQKSPLPIKGPLWCGCVIPKNKVFFRKDKMMVPILQIVMLLLEYGARPDNADYQGR